MKIALSSQPENFFPLIKRGLTLYKASFSHVFFLSFILSIISFTPSFISILISEDFFMNLSTPTLQRAWVIFINLGGLLIFSAILWQIRCTIMDIHEDLLEDAKMAFKKIPYIVIANLLQSILITGIMFLFLQSLFSIGIHALSYSNLFNIKETIIILLSILQFLIVIYLFFAFYFYMPIIVIENKNIITSLAKSIMLVWKNWWRTLCVQITPWITYLLLLYFLEKFFHLHFQLYFIQTPRNESIVILSLHIVIFAIFIPWFASNLLIQLRDLELRKNISLSHEKYSS